MSDIDIYVWAGVILIGMVIGYLASWWTTKKWDNDA